MRELFITIISALLALPLAAVEREDEAFPLDTADVVWTFTEGNRVKLLNNADAKFIDLFACIDTACHSVHLEYFNFRNDSINKLMMTLLARKLYEGVEVRILFDDFGNISNDQPIRRKHIREMRSIGFKIQSYDPMLWGAGLMCRYCSLLKVISLSPPKDLNLWDIGLPNAASMCFSSMEAFITPR